MCTAITYSSKNFYFGRTLDNDLSYGEEVVITPRRFPLPFRFGKPLKEHYAFIGTAAVPSDYPLYYDAVNEKGLCIAGLNFVGNAHYASLVEEGKNGLCQFELIPYLMGVCATLEDVKKELATVCLVNIPYCDGLPVAELHWMIADRNGAITLEVTEDGMHIYDNPVGVMTNNPPFPQQMFNLNNYMALSCRPPQNNFDKNLPLKTYSRGMGALGLPGDLSSVSRFVRTAFTKIHAASCEDDGKSICQFFHILERAFQTRGCCEMENGNMEMTIYTSCCDADHGFYYYRTYDCPCTMGVDLWAVDPDASGLFRYPHRQEGAIHWINEPLNQ